MAADLLSESPVRCGATRHRPGKARSLPARMAWPAARRPAAPRRHGEAGGRHRVFQPSEAGSRSLVHSVDSGLNPMKLECGGDAGDGGEAQRTAWESTRAANGRRGHGSSRGTDLPCDPNRCGDAGAGQHALAHGEPSVGPTGRASAAGTALHAAGRRHRRHSAGRRPHPGPPDFGLVSGHNPAARSHTAAAGPALFPAHRTPPPSGKAIENGPLMSEGYPGRTRSGGRVKESIPERRRMS
jgi:hypothetical protein